MVVLVIALAVALLVAFGVVLSVLDVGVPYLGVLSTIVLIGVLSVVFLPIYYVLPPVDVSVREVVPGAVLAAVGWVVLQVVFRVYVANATRYAASGLLGAILLFLTWLSVANIVLLLGAAVNEVRR